MLEMRPRRWRRLVAAISSVAAGTSKLKAIFAFDFGERRADWSWEARIVKLDPVFTKITLSC